MTLDELDRWWGHLTIEKKERLANKLYPDCSRWWMALTESEKAKVYREAGGRNAHEHHRWKKGNMSFT